VRRLSRNRRKTRKFPCRVDFGRKSGVGGRSDGRTTANGLQIRLRLSLLIPVCVEAHRFVGTSKASRRSLSVSIPADPGALGSNFGSNVHGLFWSSRQGRRDSAQRKSRHPSLLPPPKIGECSHDIVLRFTACGRIGVLERASANVRFPPKTEVRGSNPFGRATIFGHFLRRPRRRASTGKHGVSTASKPVGFYVNSAIGNARCVHAGESIPLHRSARGRRTILVFARAGVMTQGGRLDALTIRFLAGGR
jgi:hypothetical protein